MGYAARTNPLAKMFYGLSVVCSSSAITNGGVAIMARTCQISETAALSETCATAFMMLGNQAHRKALQVEGKPLPPRLNSDFRKSLQESVYDNNGLSFVIPSGTNSII